MTDADLITLAEREISSLPPASAAIMRALVERVRAMSLSGVVVPSVWGGGIMPAAVPTVTGGGYVPTTTTVWRNGDPLPAVSNTNADRIVPRYEPKPEREVVSGIADRTLYDGVGRVRDELNRAQPS